MITATINPEWCALHLPSRHTGLFDAADRPLVERYAHWHAIPARSTFYVQAGENTAVLLHRLITSAPPGMLVDHVNRNGLDNRRVNLRLCNQSQNLANRPAPRNNTSGYKGVHRARSGRWCARITVSGSYVHLGTFVDPWEAALAYNVAAFAAWGEFAHLNVYRPQTARDGGPGCPGPRATVPTVPGPAMPEPAAVS